MFRRRAFLVFAAVLAAGSLALLPGCDWFKGSGTGSRLSPFLSSIGVTPSSVLCDQTFSVSFHYDDPQGDIASVRVTLKQDGDPTELEESPLWPEATSRSSGTVAFPFSFACASKNKGGTWKITVRVQDEQGHSSNAITGQIKLDAAG